MACKDPEKRKEYQRRYREKYKEKINAEGILYNRNNPERIRNNYLRAEYGITLPEYNNLFSDQEGCCAICGRHQIEFKQNLHVDHNHITGKVRGLLCHQCNHGLGNFKDNTSLLFKAVEYLNENN